jgi:hypothetical protein
VALTPAKLVHIGPRRRIQRFNLGPDLLQPLASLLDPTRPQHLQSLKTVHLHRGMPHLLPPLLIKVWSDLAPDLLPRLAPGAAVQDVVEADLITLQL